MKRLAWLFLFITGINAQENIEIFGYFESQFSGTSLKGEFFQLFTNKLRVDLQSDVSDRVTVGANFDYITYNGKTEWNILDFLVSDLTTDVPIALRQLYSFRFSDEIFLDNAFVKLRFEHFDATIGKQQISLGTGYAWNPTDVFNIKDLLDPTYEQPGHTALRLDLPLGLRYTLTAIYAPEDNWRRSIKLLQLKAGIAHFDYELLYIQRYWQFTDFKNFDLNNGGFGGSLEKRQLFGLTTSGELIGLGVWAEYAFNKMSVSKDFHEGVVGLNYTFDFQTYLMIEYYRNTLGKSSRQNYDLNDWMRFFTVEQKAISRDQIYLFLQHPATDLLSAALSAIYSWNDGSIALVPTLVYNFTQNVDITAYLNINYGNDGAVYGAKNGNAGLMRIRVYF
jgi:hypothetical protein